MSLQWLLLALLLQLLRLLLLISVCSGALAVHIAFAGGAVAVCRQCGNAVLWLAVCRQCGDAVAVVGCVPTVW